MTERAVTYDDVLIIPAYSDISSRRGGEIDTETELTSKGPTLSIPIVSSNMDTVTGRELALEMHRLGGAGILHRFRPASETYADCRHLREHSCPSAVSIGLGPNGQSYLQTICDDLTAAVCIDTAHGHCKAMLEQIAWVKREYPTLPIIAGNVATGAAALDLVRAGADAVKVGVGGGCFAAGTRILMSNGTYKDIEDIRAGDRVIDRNGNPTTVISQRCTGTREVAEHRHTQFYKTTLATPDHKYLVGDFSTVSEETLSSGGYRRHLERESKSTPRLSKIKWKALGSPGRDCLLLPNRINFELPSTFSIDIRKRSGGNGHSNYPTEVISTITPTYHAGYLFGTFLGDGCASTPFYQNTHRGSVIWYFHRSETALAEKVQSALAALGFKASVRPNKNLCRVCCYSKPLADFFSTFGKKAEKHLPHFLLVDDPEYLRGIYDGLIDSDGHIDQRRINFTNTSPLLIELFNVLCYKINGAFPSNSTKAVSSGGLQGLSAFPRFSRPYLARLDKSYLKRVSPILGMQIVKRLSTEHRPINVPVYDIEVASDTHSFIANNAIVHNSLCTTRLVTGCGVPQITAISDVHNSLRLAGLRDRVSIIADGGIRHSGDIVKALVAGADSVMIGALFAACIESCGRTRDKRQGPPDTNRYRGMASEEAQKDWKGYVSVVEGESTWVKVTGTAEELVTRLMSGVRSGMSYVSARDIEELRTRAEFTLVSPASLAENRAHLLERK